MRNLILFVLVILFKSVNAQYTITASSNPVPGDVHSFNSASGTISLPAWGINKFWNYSNLSVAPGSVSNQTFVAISSIPGSMQVPGATIGSTYGGNYFDLWKHSNTERTLMGNSSLSGTSAYQNPVTFLTLPYQYGSAHYDTYAINEPNYQESGNGQSVGAGTGTLAIPGYTLNNVLMVELTFSGAGTYTSASSTSSYTFTLKENSFYSSASKFPLLSIKIFADPNDPSSADTTVEVNSLFAPVGISEVTKTENKFLVFPNPVQDDVVNLIFSKPLTTIPEIEILGITGRKIKDVILSESSIKENGIQIPIKELNPGMYFIKVKTVDEERLEKLIVTD